VTGPSEECKTNKVTAPTVMLPTTPQPPTMPKTEQLVDPPSQTKRSG